MIEVALPGCPPQPGRAVFFLPGLGYPLTAFVVV